MNQQHKLKRLIGNDKITYISGGKTKNRMSLKEWDKICENNFERYYRQQEKLIFPPKKHQNLLHEMLAQKLIDYLEIEEGSIYLFMHYDTVSHVKFHISNSEMYRKLLKDLLISSDQELQSNGNRMLLFNVKYNLMLNIRITESMDTVDIRKEEMNGQADLKLLLFLNQRFIKSTSIKLMNIVLSPNISLDDNQSICHECIILDKIILNAGKYVFRRWWKTHIIRKSSSKDICSKDSFTQIVSSVFGFIGTKQIIIKDCARFPMLKRHDKIEGDEHEEIINFIFTYKQSRVINHPALKKIVFGGYGAGKSLIGKCILYLFGCTCINSIYNGGKK